MLKYILFILLAWFCQNDFRLSMYHNSACLNWIITVYSVWCLLAFPYCFAVIYIQTNVAEIEIEITAALLAKCSLPFMHSTSHSFIHSFTPFSSIIYWTIDENLLHLEKFSAYNLNKSSRQHKYYFCIRKTPAQKQTWTQSNEMSLGWIGSVCFNFWCKCL